MYDSAIAKIKAEFSSTVTKTYAETIFNQLGTVGSGMSEAADSSNQINVVAFLEKLLGIVITI